MATSGGFGGVVDFLLRRRRKGAQPPVPVAFVPVAPKSDPRAEAAGSAEAEQVADLINEHVELDYADSKGEQSRRMVTIRAVSAKGKLYYLHCYCHLRKMPRTFRADRVESLTRITSTGEVVENVEAWVKRLRAKDPLGNVIRDNRYGLTFLLYLAQCDADYSAAERDIIADFLWERSGYSSRLSMAALVDATWSMWPDERSFKSAAKMMRTWEPEGRRALLRAARKIIDSDGHVSAAETKAWAGVAKALEEPKGK